MMSEQIHVHINWTEPLEEVFRKDIGLRHCFTCRQRRRFEHICQAPVEPSSYGPNNHIACAVCGTVDGDVFPGSGREGW